MFLEALDEIGESAGGTPKEIVLDRLVRDLHGEDNDDYTTYNIWTKFKAIYPIIGGTAAAHALNMSDKTLFPLTFHGSPTHSASGIDYNGVNQYAGTGIVLETHFVGSDRGATLFAQSITAVPYGTLFGSYSSGLFGIRTYGNVSEVWGYNNTVFGAHALGKAISVDINAVGHLYSDGVSIESSPSAMVGVTGEMFIAALNNGGPSNYGAFRNSFFAMHTSLTGTEYAFLHAAIAAYQTGLSRY